MTPGYRRAISAVGFAAMSWRSCSNLPPRMPWPTMFRKARTRVVGAIDDALLEVFEVAPSGSADIDDRRYARAGRDDVRVDAVVAGVRSSLAGAGVHMRVNVDQAGADEQPAGHRPFSRHPPDRSSARSPRSFLPAIATSLTAVMPFRGSMTWPPLKQEVVLRRREHVRTADRSDQHEEPQRRMVRRKHKEGTDSVEEAFSVFHFVFSSVQCSPSVVDDSSAPARTPPGAQILAHVELARHFVSRNRSGERKRQRIAGLSAVIAAKPNVAPIDRSGQIARDEIALMRAVDLVARLSEVQHVRRRARGVLDAHFPAAASGSRQARRLPRPDRAACATTAAHGADRR